MQVPNKITSTKCQGRPSIITPFTPQMCTFQDHLHAKNLITTY